MGWLVAATDRRLLPVSNVRGGSPPNHRSGQLKVGFAASRKLRRAVQASRCGGALGADAHSAATLGRTLVTECFQRSTFAIGSVASLS
jgi:hypothetical protein